MNTQLLESLLKLFAIIVREDGLTDQNETLVRNFLSQQFNESTARSYLGVFRKYIEQEASINDQDNIMLLSHEVNNELNYEQKIFILIRVIELAFSDTRMSKNEIEKIMLFAKHLNIDLQEYEFIYQFITTSQLIQIEHASIIHISLEESTGGENVTSADFTGEYLSAIHLKTGNMLIIRYLGSGNFILNGQQLKPGIVQILKPGAVIRGPKIEPIYFSDVLDKFLYSTRETKIILEARNIFYRFREGKMGLNGVQLVEESGRMVAIMGGSGAGKSTLLNVLNGNLKPLEGTVMINGISIHSNSDEIQGIIGYVAQEDVLVEELTVFDNLYYNAKLCFNYKKPFELELMVNNTLNELGLQEIKDLKVGNLSNDKLISGGQRKRLNIAMELIREPGVLFVDEPTSGLSSQDSQNVMDLLKELAHKGKLVIVVIHQPSSDIFKLFDRLLLLDLGGYPVFYGKPSEALRYFRKHLDYVNSDQVECPECGNINPEQIFMLLETKVIDEFGKPTSLRKMTPRQWFRLYRQSQEEKDRQRELQYKEAISEAIKEDEAEKLKEKSQSGRRFSFTLIGNKKSEEQKTEEKSHIHLEQNSAQIRRQKIKKLKSRVVEYEKLSPSASIPSKLKQIRIFMKRDIFAKLANTSYLALSSLIAPILGLGISFLLRSTPLDEDIKNYSLFFNDDLPVYLFVSILIALFIGLTISSQEILKDRKIRKREQFLHLSTFSYLIAKISVLFGLVAIQMLVYVLAGAWVLEITDLLFYHWFLLFSTACFAILLGLNLSATFYSAVTIYVTIPILLIPQIVLSGTMVSFHQLNPLISNIEVVPIVSDLAASRWAYEAIAVRQFKDNKFQELFYNYDKEISNSRYKINYYLTALETKLGYCNQHCEDINNKDRVNQQLAFLKSELEKEFLTFDMIPNNFYNILNRLYMPRFNSVVGKDVQRIINIIRNKYQKREETARLKKEKYIKQLESKNVNLEFLQHKYDNEALGKAVQNIDKRKMLIEYKGKLIRVSDPIYQEPKINKSFLDYREHFYAPQKGFLGQKFDAYWFNIMVIWSMTITLYITLYNETFRKTLELLSSLWARLNNWWNSPN